MVLGLFVWRGYREINSHVKDYINLFKKEKEQALYSHYFAQRILSLTLILKEIGLPLKDIYFSTQFSLEENRIELDLNLTPSLRILKLSPIHKSITFLRSVNIRLLNI